MNLLHGTIKVLMLIIALHVQIGLIMIHSINVMQKGYLEVNCVFKKLMDMSCNNLHNIVVYIKDDAMLQEAREILERYGQQITSYMCSYNHIDDEMNYLQWSGNLWWTTIKTETDTEITLPELEQLLKQKHGK